MCNDFVPRLLCQVQGHWKKKIIFCVFLMLFKGDTLEVTFDMKIADDTRMCHELDSGSVVQVQIII